MVGTLLNPAVTSLPLASISPFVALGFAVVIALLVKVPMRLFGRWLQRAGTKMEARHGRVVLGASEEPDPGSRRVVGEAAPSVEGKAQREQPYDPFNAD